MRSTDDPSNGAGRTVALEVQGLDVYYGRAHALQDVSLSLTQGVLAVVGRNGMGKTTLCKAITGMVPGTGSIKFEGRELVGLAPNDITHLGVAYVPQGRRVWRSLSVDETLQLAAKTARQGAWTIERVYQCFPRLAERRGNGGGQLSGGEQQMLAIGRALLFNPRLLVMDEPTEGLAPVIVEQVANLLVSLARDGSMSVLLIEQNLGVALEVADRIAVMVNGRIAHTMSTQALAADRELQRRLLGVGTGSSELSDDQADATALPEGNAPVFTLVRRRDDSQPATVVGFTLPTASRLPLLTGRSVASGSGEPGLALTSASASAGPGSALPRPFKPATGLRRAAYVVGTFDSKGAELMYIRRCLDRRGLRTVTVDLSTAAHDGSANVSAREVASHHPQGERGVFTGDRGASVKAMAEAFERFVLTRDDLAGVISAGGSGGTSLATQGMRALPVGVPKVMVSTVASGDTRAYVGASDICMVYSVTDLSGLNRISEQVLGNASHALAGMVEHPVHVAAGARPAIALSMFGVTTPCVQRVAQRLSGEFECLVFHATGVGGQSMEKLASSGFLAGVIDVTTTEIADEIVGGVFSAGPGRLRAIAESGLPYVGSCGALDMVNFHARSTVPGQFRGRQFVDHNPNVTLMRTTAEECRAIGAFIADKLNRMDAPVRFLLPEGGLSALDAPGQPFWNPEANEALFRAIEQGVHATDSRRVVRVPLHINDPAFADSLIAAFREVTLAAEPMRRNAGS